MKRRKIFRLAVVSLLRGACRVAEPVPYVILAAILKPRSAPALDRVTVGRPANPPATSQIKELSPDAIRSGPCRSSHMIARTERPGRSPGSGDGQ